MTTRRPRMPNGIDRDADRETRPVNGQRHEPGDASTSGNIVVDEAAGAASASCGDGTAPPAPDAGAEDTAPAERRAGVAPAGGETWLYARYVAFKIAQYEGRMGPEQVALENRMLPLALQTAVEPAEAPDESAAGTEARPEPPPDEAPAPMEAAMDPAVDPAMGAAAELAAAIRTFKADFVHWAGNERRGRRRRAGLAMAAGFPACLLLGLLLQVQFEVVPPHDPTQGWGGHIWNTYGPAIVDCELEAMRTNGAVDCPLTVQP